MWIEIFNYSLLYATIPKSLPSRKCGLKFRIHLLIYRHILRSLPSRKCGLKFGTFAYGLDGFKSLPSRKCGLKFVYLEDLSKGKSHFLRGSVDWNMRRKNRRNSYCVTSFAEVWIEIRSGSENALAIQSLPSRKCGLKFPNNLIRFVLLRHFLRGSVDWNFMPYSLSAKSNSHFLRGSVDWNTVSKRDM